MQVVGLFGILALLLAAVGIYGVIAYSVTQRTREIGIRVTLGATAHEVIAVVGTRVVLIVALGLLAGLSGAVAATRLIQAQLWDVTPTDPATFAAVPLLLIGIGCAACYIPARRAMKVEPVTALRAE